jgi:RNA polymerase sigma-70 factor, ECF subfamily
VEDAEHLVSRVRERDVAAFERLYRQSHRLVYGIAARMLGDADAAEDVTQTVYLTVWNQPDAFRGGNFVAWLSRVTRNRCLDYLRSKAARPFEELPIDLADEIGLEDTVLSGLDRGRVRQALELLPGERRELIEQGFFGGLTHAEIARRNGIPLGTVKTRIRSGLQELRAGLEAEVVR